MTDSTPKASSEKLAHFVDKAEITRALDTTNSELLFVALKRLRHQLNVRPNSNDHTESTLATKALVPIYAYVEDSPECTQLFKIWEWQQQNAVAKIEVPIVEVLSKMIHQCNTALHRTHSMKITRTILQNHMTVIYRHLSSGRPNTVQATLRLLTAMNHVHHLTTKELKDDFNFGLKVLSKLRNQRRKDDGTESSTTNVKADTRTLYIHFLLAFFVRGDATVKKEVLEIPDLVQKALNDLYLDSFHLVKQVLGVLLNNIVMDNELSRTSKVIFFSTPFLINLLKLYSRTEDVPNQNQTVAQLVHGFMMAICTTPGVGICFQDASWYPPSTLSSNSSVEKTSESSKQIFNKTLSQLLTHLRPTEHILQQELTIAILTACPELVRLFWQKANVQMEPRLSARWLANMTLLHKITEIPVPNLYLQHTGLFASHPPPVTTIIENILPGTANRTILSKGLQHSSMLVRYFTIVELAAAFQKTEQVIAVMQSAVRTLANDEDETAEDKDATDLDESDVAVKTSDPPAQQWANAINFLLAELRRRVPDIQIVISLHNGIQTLALTDVEQEERIRLNLFNNGVLRLIKYYQQFLPQAVSESKFDIGKLIPSDFTTVQAGTLIHLLELLLELKDFRWSNKSLDGTSSHLSKLLSLFLTTAHPHIKSLTRRLISKLLGESILFQHDPSEATLWIGAIPATNYGHSRLVPEQTHFLQFLDDCVARCLRTPYKYVDQSSKILKAVQEKSNAKSESGKQTLEAQIASSLASSHYQDLTQQYSPLLMTILEQFQHVYAKPASRDVARTISSFLYRLLPTLHRNQNRSSAMAIECLNRIQDPTKEQIESIAHLSVEDRLQLANLDVAEFLAMTFEKLEYSVTASQKKANGKNTGKKSAAGELPQELSTADRESFISMLQSLPASIVARNLKAVLQHSFKNTGSTECVTEYHEPRYPFMGSLYDMPDVAGLLQEIDMSGGSIVNSFLETLSFKILFESTTVSTVKAPLVQRLLKRAISKADSTQLALYGNLVIIQLVRWIQGGIANEATVEASFDLLAALFESARADEDAFQRVKTGVWENFALRELFLFQSEDTTSTCAYLDALDARSVDLLASTTRSHSASGNFKMAQADNILSSHYVRRCVERVTRELDNMKTVGGQALQAKTVRYLAKLAPMCHVSDLTMLLQSLLSLHRHPKFTTTVTFNALLSTILKNMSRQGGSAAAIPTQLTAALLGLWREQPSDELDAIVMDVVCGRLWPNAMSKTLSLVDLADSGVFDRAFDSLRNSALGDLDISLVDFIMGHPNQRRHFILAALMTASSAFRQRFASEVLKMSVAKRNARLDEEGTVVLLHAYMRRVSREEGTHYSWSGSATEQDRVSVDSLRPLCLQRLVSRVTSAAHDSKVSTLAAETVAMFISLDSQNNEELIREVWQKLETAPRVGLDSIAILEALLAKSREEDDEHEDLERQDKVAKWFEKTANQLISVLDKDGDAFWLEPVYDKLYGILDTHVKERVLSINQKILFELVSFAIEKALDNVALIRFSTLLAKKYYAETSQTSALPQILQTLFKHKQFSSLVMATAPTTKHIIPENLQTRLAIVHLIYTLTILEPETCCKAGFLPMLLSCYSASTCLADQLLLAVLRTTEGQTGGSISNRAPVWGEGADNLKSANALFGQAMINDSLDLIDPNVMMTTVLHFPADWELEAALPQVTLKDYSEENIKQRQAPIYDPSFMLPLFGTYMAFGTLLDCRKLIEANGLGLIIVALSSNDENMRLAAFSLLDDFYATLSHATMREKNQLILLLDSLKNSIVEREDDSTPRVPTVITTFVAHALSTLLRPDHFMYPHVNKFCLQRPTIDLEDIPMFYSLLHSSSDQHRKERVWMLRLLATSLKTGEDYKLFRRRHVIDLLLALFNSQLSEPLSKKIVVEVLFNAAAIPSVTLQLVTKSAFLSWLHTLTVTSAMTSENEFSLVPARLLLRILQSCPKESIRWMNGVWRNQVVGIATSLLRQLSVAKVSSNNLAWALTSLESILQIFTFLESNKDTGLSTSQPASQCRFLTSFHVSMVLQFLLACEQVMVISPDQCPVPIPASWESLQSPNRSDSLEILYKVDPIPVLTHSRVVRLGFNLMSSQGGLSVEDQDVILSRALCYRIEEAIEMARRRDTSV